jgi:hypothetical protein
VATLFLSAHSHSRPVGLSPAIRMSFIIINMPQDYKNYFRLFVRKTASMHTRRETPFRGRTCRTGPGSGATQRGNMELQAGYPAQNCLAGSRPPVAYICGSCHFFKNRQNAFCQSWLSPLLVKSCQKNASLVVTPVKTWVQAVRNRLKLLDVPPARD